LTKEKEKDKLPGPKRNTGASAKLFGSREKSRPRLVRLLKAVVRKSATGETASNIRVFDQSEGIARKLEVKDYTSLDDCVDLIIYEGWFDEGGKQVKLEEKKKVNWDTPIFAQAEIQQKIETLKTDS
jgi:hypothetical protein